MSPREQKASQVEGQAAVAETADTNHRTPHLSHYSRPGLDLKEQVRSLGRLLHLLFFHEPSTNDLIDGRFHERRADGVTVPVAFAKVRNREHR